MKIESCSQASLIGFKRSLKNGSPSCRARTGNCCTTLSLIRQFLSCERSVRLGMIDSCKFSIPMTAFKFSKRLNRFKRTSELSSRSRLRKMGRTWSFVGPRSIIGQIDKIFSARADRTYVNESLSKSLRFGMILTMIDYASKILQKSDNLPTAAVLTSDSASLRKFA